MADPKEELIQYAYGKTVCQQRPELCKPRNIAHVVFDADDTMWHIEPHAIATNITGPLKLIDPDTVEATEDIGYSFSYELEKTPKPRTPVTQTYNEKTGEWEWEHKKTGQLPMEPDWWALSVGATEDDELLEILDELYESREDTTPSLLPEKTEEAVWLDDLHGWKKRQQEAVDKVLKMYPKRTCKVVNVISSGDIEVDCAGDRWIVTSQGQSLIDQLQSVPQKEVKKPKKKPSPKSKTHTGQTRRITIKLLPTFRNTLDELDKREIQSSVVSLNAPGSVKRILEVFGLDKRFVEIRDTWNNKGQMFDEIAKNLKVCPCDMMFVDDNLRHIEDVSNKCGLSLQIGKGKDIEKPIQVIDYILPREK